MSNPAKTVGTVVVIGLAALIGIVIFSSVAGVVLDDPFANTDENTIEPVGGAEYLIDDEVTDPEIGVNVFATREKAVYSDGDGYVDADPPAGWDDGNWSVTAVANPDTADDTTWNGKATHTIIAVDNETLVVSYDDGQWSAYYDDGSVSAKVNVSATTDETPIVVTRDADAGTLSIHAEEATDTKALDTDTEQRGVNLEWAGTIDEVRFINGTLTDSQIQTFRDDPINPLDVTTHEARWMFDEGEGPTSKNYYNGTDAQLVGVGWAGGVVDPGLSEGVDYAVSFDPLTVTILADGYLDPAPVAYVVWRGPLSATAQAIIGGFSGAFELLPVVMLILMASVVIATINKNRQ